MTTTLNPLDHPVCLLIPKRLTQFSAWHEHVPFAMFLVDVLRPGKIVELGAYYGDSYCAFCQAVKELNLSTHCYAVDTWQGDPHTNSFGQDVLTDLRNHHDIHYSSFSRLIQSSFDDAVFHFKDGSIDLLHIDGYHTYEVVKHDFETWLPKVSPKGVILFHDTNVREKDFGAWKLWDELKIRYPHFEFLHGHGLGVLGVGRDYPKAFQYLLEASNEDIPRIRSFFFELGHRLTLQSQQTVMDCELKGQRQSLGEKEKQVALLSENREHLSQKVTQLEARMQYQHQLLDEKEKQVAQLLIDRERLSQQVQLLKEKEVVLNHIYNLHGWKALLFYYKIRNKIITPSNAAQGKDAKFTSKMLLKLKHFFKNKIQNIYYHCDNPLRDGMDFYGDFIVSGWAIAPKGISKIEIYCDNAFLGDAIYGLLRPDVRSLHPFIPDSEKSGFRFPTINLVACQHTITIKMITKKGKIGTVTRRINVKQSDNDSGPISTRRKIKISKTKAFIKNKTVQETVVMKADSIGISHTLQGLKLELLNSIKSASS